MKSGKKNGGRLHKKNEEKGLKNAFFCVIISKKISPASYSSGKNKYQRGEGEIIEMHNIYN